MVKPLINRRRPWVSPAIAPRHVCRRALTSGERWPQGKAISRQACAATIRWFTPSQTILDEPGTGRWLAGRASVPLPGGSESRRSSPCVPLLIVDWEHLVESRYIFAGFLPYSGCFDRLGRLSATLVPSHTVFRLTLCGARGFAHSPHLTASQRWILGRCTESPEAFCRPRCQHLPYHTPGAALFGC